MSEETKMLGEKRQKLRRQLREVTDELKTSIKLDIELGEKEAVVARNAQIDRAGTLRPWLGK